MRLPSVPILPDAFAWTMTCHQNDLTDFLTIDLEEVEQEHRRLRRLAVRNRFLAGLADSLEKHPGIKSVWIGLRASSSRHWVRSSQSLSEHDEAMRQKTSDENRETKLFYASLGSTRKAISSNARESVDALHLLLPAWIGTREYPRFEVIHIARHLLANPERVLTEDLVIELREKAWGEALPDASTANRPSPRL